MTPAGALRSSIREIADPVIDSNPLDDKQVPPMNRPADARPRTAPHTETSQNRTLTMQLMPQALARVHMQERMQEAERERLLRAFHLKRRAERASLRARRALASVVL
ncbi:hypothetical protein ABH931_001332 [Streptacidiphilus sp. MAP12-33]|uniref:hypothetical protein n=1 Tax=Streptacidiphilus sp. MAP12-33 TaxID=3156266 RepID=UPI00351317AE